MSSEEEEINEWTVRDTAITAKINLLRKIIENYCYLSISILVLAIVILYYRRKEMFLITVPLLFAGRLDLKSKNLKE